MKDIIVPLLFHNSRLSLVFATLTLMWNCGRERFVTRARAAYHNAHRLFLVRLICSASSAQCPRAAASPLILILFIPTPLLSPPPPPPAIPPPITEGIYLAVWSPHHFSLLIRSRGLLQNCISNLFFFLEKGKKDRRGKSHWACLAKNIFALRSG